MKDGTCHNECLFRTETARLATSYPESACSRDFVLVRAKHSKPFSLIDYISTSRQLGSTPISGYIPHFVRRTVTPTVGWPADFIGL